MPLFLLFLGRVAPVVRFIRGVDRNEVAVEQTDDPVVRERTAPEIGGAASATANVHLSDVAEQEDRTAVLPRQPLGRTNPRDPADGVETPFLRGRLQLLDSLFDLLTFQRSGRLRLFRGRRKYQQANAYQDEEPQQECCHLVERHSLFSHWGETVY